MLILPPSYFVAVAVPVCAITLGGLSRYSKTNADERINMSINMDKRKFLIITQAIFIADISIFLPMFRIRTICFSLLSPKQNCAAVYFCYFMMV